jgi:acylphosphatase
MSTASDRVRRRVMFHGRVQGVGFRFTAYQLAAGRPIVGFVRNLADGTVALEAEGPAGDVTDFLSDLSERFHRNITEARSTDLAPTGRETAFEITN